MDPLQGNPVRLAAACLAAAYLLDCWLHGSLFADRRAYVEARWPAGPLLCRLCLSFYSAAAAVGWLWLAGLPGLALLDVPVTVLAVAWVVNRFSSTRPSP